MKKHQFPLLVLSLLALLFLGGGCWTTTVTVNTNATETNSQAQEQLSVELTLNKGDGAPVTYPETVVRGTTALALLQTVAEKNNIALTTQQFDFGVLVMGIGDLQQTSSQYWNFIVNGQPATVGASTYELQAGDKIEFRYGS